MARIRSIFTLSVLSICIHFASADDAIEVLERAVENGIEAIENDDDRAIIQFWLDAGRVDDDELHRCTIDYLRTLQNRIQIDIRSTRMTDVTRLYDFVEYDLLSSCGIQVAELARQVLLPLEVNQIAKLDEPTRMFDLWFCRGTQTETSFKSVAEAMMWALGADLCLDRTSFIRTWNQGPCSGILDQVAQTSMQPLANYVAMLTDARVYPLHLGSDVSLPTIGAVSAIRYCEYFSSEQALSDAWYALQTSDTYQSIRDQILGLTRNNAFRSPGQ